MHIESVSLTNFRCFGPTAERLELRPDITALIGTNGSGKTAVSVALQRMFGITSEERTVQKDDFHVPVDEQQEPASRSLSIDAVLAFPELAEDTDALLAIPGFFSHMSTAKDGTFKCRIRLEATWTADSTVDGAIDSRLVAVRTLDDAFSDDQVHSISNAERSRIQFVYVPASRDGARQVTTFLRGRIWRAAKWSEELRDYVRDTANQISEKFHAEKATSLVEETFSSRWRQLQGAGLHATPRFVPVETDVEQLLRSAELSFEPDPSAASRPAHSLSDGQRSLLHLALTAATLDIEAGLAGEKNSPFADAATLLPYLTVLAVEEPENNLSPFYLSRIISQLLELGAKEQIQSMLSTHSSSALTRIAPDQVRYFRRNEAAGLSSIRALVLPPVADEASKYVREAVQAHPEIYFARFVVLGEGDSEQVVLPAIGRAMGVDFDPSFIAMVPLGGRHTNHFWRLLTDLGIPHATLLDLDVGRAGGGRGRLKTAVETLASVGIDVLGPLEMTLDEVTSTGSTASIVAALQEHGVFFSTLLDLDMTMLQAYRDAYTSLPEGAVGPQASSALDSVLGKGASEKERAMWSAPEQETDLRWYRYLFSNRSKPSTHLRAIGLLTQPELANAPKPLGELITFAITRIDPT